jgi:hypothetical protein
MFPLVTVRSLSVVKVTAICSWSQFHIHYEICGSHGDVDDDAVLQGCDAV